MTRTRYLVCYDIADPMRLRRVCQIMQGFGVRMQYSVFLCDLAADELTDLRFALRSAVHQAVDSVIIISLGPAYDASGFEFVGRAPSLPDGSPNVF
jgi:CRISPR-associated protein Cas2